jgi:uncharacterized protein
MESDQQAIRRMLGAKRIAVVGISVKPWRASHRIAQYLRMAGYEVIPVNPRYREVIELPCYPAVKDAPGPIDVVNVLRRAEFCPDVVRDAIAAGARGVWVQSGIVSPEAARLAAEAGIDYVQDHCIMVEHMSRKQ